MLKEVKLPSGAVLKIGVSSFARAKALYQALLREAKGVSVTSETQLIGVYKDLFCVGFSSPEIEKCLFECFQTCIYNDGSGLGDLKIDENTFEPVNRRNDYMKVCVEVMKENVLPFTKSLFAEYSGMVAIIEKVQKSNQ